MSCSRLLSSGQCGIGVIRLKEMIMKILFVLMILLLDCCSSFMATSTSEKQSGEIHQINNRYRLHSVKTTKSENGEVIDCVPLNRQPAFTHPSLKNHKIQMNPSAGTFSAKSTASNDTLRQVWHKYGNCLEGTIPIRRVNMEVFSKSSHPVESFGRNLVELPRLPKDMGMKNIVPEYSTNTSRAYLVTAGYAYFGAKAEMDVANPHVQMDDEYSLAEVAVINGDDRNYEIAEAGWGVNPGLYGDRRTHFFVYWSSVGPATSRTGCFDLTCPGFIQTSKKVALGGAMDVNDIPVPGGLGSVITVWLVKDIVTGNWWVKTGGDQEPIGYFPASLFTGLNHIASIVQWGGEIHSSRIKSVKPHTQTEMGNGWKNGAQMRNIEVLRNNNQWLRPYPTATIIDEINCYIAEYYSLRDEPYLDYGGSGAYCSPP